jgi:hypothetical protein
MPWYDAVAAEGPFIELGAVVAEALYRFTSYPLDAGAECSDVSTVISTVLLVWKEDSLLPWGGGGEAIVGNPEVDGDAGMREKEERVG